MYALIVVSRGFLKKDKIFLESSENLSIVQLMPNQHGPDREPLGGMFERPLVYKFKKVARKKGVDVTELIRDFLKQATENMPLNSADYQSIADATKRAAATRKRISTPLADQ